MQVDQGRNLESYTASMSDAMGNTFSILEANCKEEIRNATRTHGTKEKQVYKDRKLPTLCYMQ